MSVLVYIEVSSTESMRCALFWRGRKKTLHKYCDPNENFTVEPIREICDGFTHLKLDNLRVDYRFDVPLLEIDPTVASIAV